MGDDLLLVIFAVFFPVLLLGEVVLLVVLWRSREASPRPGLRAPQPPTHADQVAGEVGLVSTWLISSGVAMAIAFIAAFVAVHVVLFSFGTTLAMLGLILSVAVLGAIPVVMAFVLRRRAHHR
jgi:hypothetical protein